MPQISLLHHTLKDVVMKNLTFEELPEAVAGLYVKLTKIEELLLELNQTPKTEADQVLSVTAAAEFLSLAVPTLYGYVQRKEIPVNKRNNRLYFLKEELVEWIKAGRKKTASEAKAEACGYSSHPMKKGGML